MSRKIVFTITLTVLLQLASPTVYLRSCPNTIDNCSACAGDGKVASFCYMCAEGFARDDDNKCIKAKDLPTDKGFEHCIDLKQAGKGSFKCYQCKFGYFVTTSVSGCQKIETKSDEKDAEGIAHAAHYVQNNGGKQVKACYLPYYPSGYDDRLDVFRSCSNAEEGKPDGYITDDCEIIGADILVNDIVYGCLKCKGDKIPVDGKCRSKPRNFAEYYDDCVYLSQFYDEVYKCPRCQPTHKNVRGGCVPVATQRLIV